MLAPVLKSSQRHPPSPKEFGETEVKSRKKDLHHPISFTPLALALSCEFEGGRFDLIFDGAFFKPNDL